MALAQQAPPRPRNRQLTLQDTSFGHRVNLGLWIADLAALSVMVYLRRQIGFRLLKPARLIGLFLLLAFANDIIGWVFGWINPLPGILGAPQGESILLAAFTLGMLVLGLYQRISQWRDVKKGELRWMTTSRGVSWLEFLPVAQHIVYRFLDPLACFVAGFLLFKIFGAWILGFWLMFAALMFCIGEQQAYDQQLHHSLDMLDSMMAAKAQARLVQFYSAEKQEIRLSRAETAGLPTGIGRDVERLIAERYAMAAAAGNLSPDAATASPSELAAEAVKRATGAPRGPIDGRYPPSSQPPDNLASPSSSGPNFVDFEPPPSDGPAAPDNLAPPPGRPPRPPRPPGPGGLFSNRPRS